jgi:stage III sporulation protein SpoIIIAA
MIEESDILINEDQLETGTKAYFYKVMKMNGIDFDDIDDANRLPKYMVRVIKNEPAEYNKFNNILYKLNKEKRIAISDAMTYLVDDWLEPQIVLKCLDELNYYSLMNSLKEKYNIGKGNSTLDEFFV